MRVSLIDPSLFTLPYDRALAGGLAAAGHQVTLHGRRAGADDGDTDGIAPAADFYRFASRPAVAALPTALRLGIKGADHAVSMVRLLRRLRRDRPDVIHFQWLALPVVDGRFLPALRRIAPLVLTVHDTDPFNGDPTAGVQRHGFLRCLHAFDRLVVHTAQGRDRLHAHGIAPGRLSLLPHGPLLALPGHPGADAMQDVLTLVLFGKIKPYKGADLLIEAFALLPPALQAQARIRIVGKPYMDLAPLHRLAQARGVADRVAVEPRFVADGEIAGLFAPGTVALFPYREIEASGVLSIALALGRPVIASNLGSFGETLEDGVQGHLVPPGDVPALAAALAHMIGDRRFAASCASEARALAERAPTWHDIGQQTAALYDEAASRPAGDRATPGAGEALTSRAPPRRAAALR